MTTPPPPSTWLGTITGYGYEFAATGDADSMALTRMTTRGRTHTTGQLTWNAAQGAFIPSWNSDAYPRIEPDSLLEMHLLDSARQFREAIVLGTPLSAEASVQLAQPLSGEQVQSILDKGANR